MHFLVLAARQRNRSVASGYRYKERNRERARRGEIFIEKGQTCRERCGSGIEWSGRRSRLGRY
jgi:hypothetical protein